MSTHRGFAVAVLALLGAPLLAQAQRTVQLQVTSVGGQDVYVDAGRSAGLRPGMIVRLFVPGAAAVPAEVRAVSTSSARLRLVTGGAPPPVGTRGEVEVADEPETSPRPPRERTPRDVPEHPPWQREATALGADQPLLAFATAPRPEQRPMTVNGRVFAAGQWNRDRGGGRDSEYWLGRLGVAGEARNALGLGDRIRFDGEVNDRLASSPGRVDDRDTTGRLDLLSLALGTAEQAPLGVELGRFQSRHLPELGLIDGVEGVARFTSGLQVGAGFGAYPVPFPSRDAGDDVSAHVFVDYRSEEPGAFAAALGVQKTWHRGTADRDLLVLRAEGRPADGWWWFLSAKVDYYTDDDTRKDRTVELTEFIGQARWDGADVGAGLLLSHFAWPDLLREEYQNLPDELVTDGEVDRASVSGWGRPGRDLRLSARVDYWQDQERSGTAFELGCDHTDLLGSGVALGATAFHADGAAQSGPGVRLSLRRRLGDVALRAAYRWYRYELDRLVSGPETWTRQSAALGISWQVADVDVDLDLEHWFGDDEDAFALALYSQWRF